MQDCVVQSREIQAHSLGVVPEEERRGAARGPSIWEAPGVTAEPGSPPSAAPLIQ
jgi:hypothetical protein